jgi:hypothetical protein
VKISDLNAKNSEAHLISARYEIVAATKASLGLLGEHAEENRAQIASIKELRKNIENGAKYWDDNVEQLHSICRGLTPTTDAARIENLIAMVQIASDDVKKYNEISVSSLHILEGTNSIIKASLSEFDEKLSRINVDFEQAIRRFHEKGLE